MNILKEVRREFKANIEEKYKIGNQRYFKEKNSEITKPFSMRLTLKKTR